MRTLRKRRAVIFDDEPSIQTLFKDYFSQMGYEVLTYGEPLLCPVYGQAGSVCEQGHPCADVLITDDQMPRMSGVELLRMQADNGCKMPPENKALMSGDISDEKHRIVSAMGCAAFVKPFSLRDMDSWIAACEQRMDLSQPLATRRNAERYPAAYDVRYFEDRGNTVRTATAVNISTTGLCLKVPAPLLRKQSIRIDTVLPIMSHMTSVRWVSELGNGAFLAGLQCC